jgi:hypothetical protein
MTAGSRRALAELQAGDTEPVAATESATAVTWEPAAAVTARETSAAVTGGKRPAW